MRKFGIFLVFLICLLLMTFGCFDFEIDTIPFECKDTLIRNDSLQEVNFPNSEMGILVPKGWEKVMLDNDTTSSVIIVDTDLLRINGIVKSITLSKVKQEAENLMQYLDKEVLFVEENYKLLDRGIWSRNSIHFRWLLVKEEKLFTLAAYTEVNGGIKLISLTTSEENDYQTRLCELIEYLKTVNF